MTHFHLAAFIGASLVVGSVAGGYASLLLGRSFLSELRSREAALVFSAVESGPLTFARLQSASIAQAQLENLMRTAGIKGRPIVGVVIKGGLEGSFEFANWSGGKPADASCLARETRAYSFADALNPYSITVESDACLPLPEEKMILRNALIVGLLVSLMASLAGLMGILPVIDSFRKTRRMLQNPLSPEPSSIRFLPLRELALLAFRGFQAERNEALAEFAHQVAHDIRSPLAALEVASGDAVQLPDDQRRLIGGAVGRIRDIANSLLDKQRSLAAGADIFRARQEGGAPNEAEPVRLGGLVESLVAEKRIEYRSRSTALELRFDANADISARVQPAEFKRVLSNLINNSMEALSSGRGSVGVELSAQGDQAVVLIRDDGPGIPAEILAKLGRRGETHGKSGGSGLGLHYARACAESWGGTLGVASEPGKGTAVTLSLPKATAPERMDAVLIDDDALVRATWKIAAKKSGKTLRAFSAPSEFLIESGPIDRATPVYIDSDLGESIRGEAEALKIHGLGFREIYLATGHASDKFAGLAHLRGVVGKEPPWTREA